MPRLAVLGQPIGHSRSPAMHTAALRELRLAEEWSYEAIEVAPGDFERRVRTMPGEGFAGANVTVPHKVAALGLADSASGTARAIGAANTLSFIEGRIEAENTDADGFVAALGRSPAGLRALVLGAGGSARAAAWALAGAGATVSIWNRTPARAEGLARDLGAAVAEPVNGALGLAEVDLLVNATTVGMEAATGAGAAPGTDLAAVRVDPRQLEPRHLVVDLVYGSAETALIAAARERGAATVDGLEVLVQQGAASLRIWTGVEPPLETMRAAAREALPVSEAERGR